MKCDNILNFTQITIYDNQIETKEAHCLHDFQLLHMCV